MKQTPDQQTTDLTLAGVAHDLNNVFQTLVEAADLLSEDAKWESLSALIVRSVERGKELTLSLQTADQPLSDQPSASLEAILAGAQSFVEDSFIRGLGPKIYFVFDADPSADPSIVLRHSRSWERVFVNLFSNAVHAMPRGGTIFVHARHIGPSLQIVVSDDGPGISPELLPDIFEPHVSSRSDGGLGLHIVRTLIKQEHGQVRAANAARGGAEFTIIVPAEPVLLRRVSA